MKIVIFQHTEKTSYALSVLCAHVPHGMFVHHGYLYILHYDTNTSILCIINQLQTQSRQYVVRNQRILMCCVCVCVFGIGKRRKIDQKHVRPLWHAQPFLSGTYYNTENMCAHSRRYPSMRTNHKSYIIRSAECVELGGCGGSASCWTMVRAPYSDSVLNMWNARFECKNDSDVQRSKLSPPDRYAESFDGQRFGRVRRSSGQKPGRSMSSHSERTLCGDFQSNWPSKGSAYLCVDNADVAWYDVVAHQGPGIKPQTGNRRPKIGQRHIDYKTVIICQTNRTQADGPTWVLCWMMRLVVILDTSIIIYA